MKKALRMGYYSYFEEEVFAKNLSLVAKNLDVIDEITLFTEPTHHGYWETQHSAETAALLTDRIKRYKAVGVKRVGLNVLCTIGHTEDGAAIAPRSELQYMVNLDGVASKSCLCPSDDRFHDYIAKRYSMFAKTGADFIWIDDDLRISNHGVVRDYCFCPACVEKFNLKYGTGYDIIQIREKFRSDPSFRPMWRASISDTVRRLCETIRDAVKGTDPTVEIGYMSGLGETVSEWISASGSTLGRPGGGFYNDLNPIQMFDKHFQMQQIIQRYPKEITDIQYEYESYNFLTLQKSLHISELESSLMILSGCNGMLYNRWEHTQDFLDMMRASAKKWDVLAESSAGGKTYGVYCASSLKARCLNEIGIPVTPHVENACACYVIANEWNSYRNDEIEKMLKIGVYTDGDGLLKLKERGFDDLGGEIAASYENGVWEHFPEHPFQRNISNRERFTSLDIFHETNAFALSPVAGAEVISVLNSAFGGLRGCSAYVYRRGDGSVIVVDGCLMPKQIQTGNKKQQMTNAFERISANRLPVVIEKSVKVVPTVSANQSNVSMMLTNAHFDPTGEFEVKIRMGRDFRILTDVGELLPIEQRRTGEETVLTVPSIGAWQYLLLIGSV